MADNKSALLEVSDLSIRLGHGASAIDLVDGVSFTLDQGGRLGLVGESGSGKSMLALAILGLLPRAMSMSRGSIRLNGRELAGLSPAQMRKVRGREVSMIFQEPATALNPVFTTGEQIAEVIRRHENVSRAEARQRTVDLLRQVGIPSPEHRARQYPHQMSGGMRQRVMIAMALACKPRLLIADEPTTALDATIQTQIMDLLARLQEETGVAILFISHDLPLVSSFARQMLVMYAGRVVEAAPARSLFAAPGHPYTRGLIACALGLEDAVETLPTIEGHVPGPADFPPGCRFSSRCPHAAEICQSSVPRMERAEDRHALACFRREELGLQKVALT